MVGKRLLVYDATCRPSMGLGLSHAWWLGATLTKGLRRFDAVHGACNWDDAFTWLLTHSDEIAEIQFWMHGKWGEARIGDAAFNIHALDSAHPYAPYLQQMARAFSPHALVWFRTCETLGAQAGHAFAQALTQALQCRVAGHTYIIGHMQSGLHVLHPNQSPTWSTWEGLAEGTPAAPVRAKWSRWREPSTITCLQMTLPRARDST